MGPQAKAEMDIDNLDVLADRGYFSGEEVMACEPLGVMPYVPKPLTSGTKADVRFGKQDFVYIPEQDSLPSAGPDAGDELCTVRLAFDTRRVRGGLIIEAPGVRPEVAPRPDRTLIRALALAAIWSRELATGNVSSIKALARREGLCNHYTSRLLPLAYLAPDIAEQILQGRQASALSLAVLTSQPMPLDWGDQRRLVARLAGGSN